MHPLMNKSNLQKSIKGLTNQGQPERILLVKNLCQPLQRIAMTFLTQACYQIVHKSIPNKVLRLIHFEFLIMKGMPSMYYSLEKIIYLRFRDAFCRMSKIFSLVFIFVQP